ncbi:unnamed protein product [Chrysoparadoxa australica]
MYYMIRAKMAGNRVEGREPLKLSQGSKASPPDEVAAGARVAPAIAGKPLPKPVPSVALALQPQQQVTSQVASKVAADKPMPVLPLQKLSLATRGEGGGVQKALSSQTARAVQRDPEGGVRAAPQTSREAAASEKLREGFNLMRPRVRGEVAHAESAAPRSGSTHVDRYSQGQEKQKERHKVSQKQRPSQGSVNSSHTSSSSSSGRSSCRSRGSSSRSGSASRNTASVKSIATATAPSRPSPPSSCDSGVCSASSRSPRVKLTHLRSHQTGRTACLASKLNPATSEQGRRGRHLRPSSQSAQPDKPTDKWRNREPEKVKMADPATATGPVPSVMEQVLGGKPAGPSLFSGTGYSLGAGAGAADHDDTGTAPPTPHAPAGTDT